MRQRDWSKYRVPKFTPSGKTLQLLHAFKEEALDWLEEMQAEMQAAGLVKAEEPEPDAADDVRPGGVTPVNPGDLEAGMTEAEALKQHADGLVRVASSSVTKREKKRERKRRTQLEKED